MFLISEGIALFNKASGDTLSETVWAWLKGKQRNTDTVAVRAYGSTEYIAPKNIKWNHNTWRTWVVGSFLLWLFFHLTFGWFSS